MNDLIRHIRLVTETITSGPAYGIIKYLIRSPVPLDPERSWRFVTRKSPPVLGWLKDHYPPRWWLLLWHRRELQQDHAVGISEHYDASNDFYELFLDKDFLFYTCADFHSPQESIEEAQRHKADFLLALIDPQPGERILELGCGWGSMMKHVYAATQDRNHLEGYTLSREQERFIREKLGFQVSYRNFITCDYPREAFDKIYSIGAWEHIRPEDHLPLMEKLYATLRPGGRLVLHFFCYTSDHRSSSVICGGIFFPGSRLASYRFYVDDFERVGFRITHRSIHDYRPTLRAWFDRLVEQKERALELVGVETYNRYLLFFPSSWRFFNEGMGFLVRWVLEKPT